MAWRLGNYVVEGTLDNRQRLSTRGEILLRDREQPIELDLTGNMNSDLAGKLLYFRARAFEFGGFEALSAAELPFEPRQFGATGTITAHHLVRVFPGSIDAFLRRCELGEPPPISWKRCLAIEWFSANGRVLIQLADPEMWFLEPDANGTGWIRHPLPPPEPEPFDANQPPGDSAGDTLPPSWSEDDEEEADSDESYGLVPREILDYLERFSADATSTSDSEIIEEIVMSGDEETFEESQEEELTDEERAEEAILRDLEAMDRLLENGPGMDIGEVIGKNPAWDILSEEEAETHLKCIVARLALYRVAFSVCPHCTAREAYRILTEKIALEAAIEPTLRDTDWVTHFDTSDDCPQCMEETLQEWSDDDFTEDP